MAELRTKPPDTALADFNWDRKLAGRDALMKCGVAWADTLQTSLMVANDQPEMFAQLVFSNRFLPEPGR